MDRIFLCRTSDLEINQSKEFRLEGGFSIALCRTATGYHAVENRCPHAGATLHEGILQKETLMCIWHGWKFNLKSGKCLNRRNAGLNKFTIQIDNDRIYIMFSPDFQSRGKND